MAKKSKSFRKWIVGTLSIILGTISSKALDYFIGTNILGKIWEIIVFIWDFFLLKFETPLWLLLILPFAGVGLFLFVDTSYQRG